MTKIHFPFFFNLSSNSGDVGKNENSSRNCHWDAQDVGSENEGGERGRERKKNANLLHLN